MRGIRVTGEDVGYCAEGGFDGGDLGGVFEDVGVVLFEEVHPLRGVVGGLDVLWAVSRGRRLA